MTDSTPELDELRALRGELRELVREAHGVLKDLRRESREARELVPLLTDELFTAEVKKQTNRLGRATEQAMDQAVERVSQKFDQLAATFLGEDRTSRRRGLTSIPELVDRRAAGGDNTPKEN